VEKIVGGFPKEIEIGLEREPLILPTDEERKSNMKKFTLTFFCIKSDLKNLLYHGFVFFFSYFCFLN